MLSKEEIEKAKEKLELMEYKYTLTNNDDKAIETILQYIDQLEFQIQAKEKENKYDVNMIDEVKGEAVKLYKEIDKLNKINDEMANELAGWSMFGGELQEPIILYTKKEVKQYFEKKVEEK